MAIAKVYGYGKIGKLVLSTTKDSVLNKPNYPETLPSFDKYNTNCLVDAYRNSQRKLNSDIFQKK